MQFVGKSILVSALIISSYSAQAWDQHHHITTKALGPIATILPKSVPVHSLDLFLKNAFPKCDQKTFFDRVMEGVGPRYKVFYVNQVNYKLEWKEDLYNVETLLSPIATFFAPPDQQAGTVETDPSKVLAVYSDEPDWLMDVDVPSYASKKQKIKGTGSNLFRHFWFGKSMPVRFELDTPQHTKRIFELSMAAFAAGEHYWGYRFLAQATHYIQDVTQPFHTQPVPSYAMVRKKEFLMALIDDYKRRVNAKREKRGLTPKYNLDMTPAKLPLDEAILFSGMAVTTYHSIFEGFARVLTKAGLTNSEQIISETHRIPVDPNLGLNTWNFDVSQFVMDVAEKTRHSSEELGQSLVAIFGKKYKTADGVAEVYKTIFSDENPGAQLALGKWTQRRPRQQAIDKIYGLTSDLLDNSTQTTRLFILRALTTPAKIQNQYLSQLQELCDGSTLIQ